MDDGGFAVIVIGALIALFIAFGLGLFIGYWCYYWEGWKDGQEFYLAQSRRVYLSKEIT